MTPRRNAIAVLFTVLAFLAGVRARGQASTQPVRDREIVGHLGITAIECDCTFDGRNPGSRDFRFRSNLVVLGVAPAGPSAGLLFAGDTIFEVDGTPLRSREGGSIFANIRPGQRATLGVRRAGRVLRVGVTAAGINANDPSGLGQYMPLAPGSAEGNYGFPRPRVPAQPGVTRAPDLPIAPRASALPGVTRAPEAPQTPRASPLASTAPVAAMPPVPPSPASPDGWFGFSIRCNQCGWSRERNEDSPRWESSTPPQIGIVAAGGPADIAGLKTGDRITHIDGASILGPEGARRFGAVRPGQRIRLTVTRNGLPITRELTLDQRPRPALGRSSLRYTGRLRGVDIEVWSPAGATVERDGDTMTINVGGSTIRLKATGATPPPGN
jgi:hypothetical protein